MPATGKRASYNKTPDKASPFAAVRALSRARLKSA
jgi:hypothetical protein